MRENSGAIYATYTYDSWGRCVSVKNSSGAACSVNTVAVQSSIRYRGYVYDYETGLYYLQSRYYDPEVGRFLNADDVDFIGYSGEVLSYNAFAYCENNAVDRVDTLGTTFFDIFDMSYKTIIINYLIERMNSIENKKITNKEKLIKRINNSTKINFNQKKARVDGVTRYNIVVENKGGYSYIDEYIFYIGDWFGWNAYISSYENEALYKLASNNTVSVIKNIVLFILGIKNKFLGKVFSIIDIAGDIPINKFVSFIEKSRIRLDSYKANKNTYAEFIFLAKIKTILSMSGVPNSTVVYNPYSGDGVIEELKVG